MVPRKIKDIDAYTRLYDKYAPALYGVILKQTPDVQLACSILEKSFVKIWDEFDCYNPSRGALFSLMLRITLQQCGKEVAFRNLFDPQEKRKTAHV